jgi:hypothetical protein
MVDEAASGTGAGCTARRVSRLTELDAVLVMYKTPDMASAPFTCRVRDVMRPRSETSRGRLVTLLPGGSRALVDRRPSPRRAACRPDRHASRKVAQLRHLDFRVPIAFATAGLWAGRHCLRLAEHIGDVVGT